MMHAGLNQCAQCECMYLIKHVLIASEFLQNSISVVLNSISSPVIVQKSAFA